MRVLLTGATGFTGRRVARDLSKAGHELVCFARPTSDRSVLDDLPVEWAAGDLADPGALAGALDGAAALVNVASLGFGQGPGIVSACRAAGVRRAVFFSTTAIFTSLPASSRAVRLEAEDAVRGSGLEWTILRPTMIYGAPGDRNVERLLRFVARAPALPMLGRGDRLIQPVLVDDLADAVVRVLESRRAAGRAYCVPGRAPISFRGFVREAARALGRRPLLVPVPAALAVAAAGAYESLSARPRIRREQVLRLMEDKDFTWEDARRDFAYDPAHVREGLRLEVSRLGLGGTD